MDVPYAFLFSSYDGAKKAVEEANVQARFYGVQGGKCYVLGPLYVEGDPEKIDRLLAIHGKLAEGIDIVILKIEHGTPLVGKCEICPLQRS